MESRREYKEARQVAKREVAKAKGEAYDELYERLDTRKGENDVYRLARQREKSGKDVQKFRTIKDADGNVLTSGPDVLRRWREYFEGLLNEENERERGGGIKWS